jgi:hypothetical protein
MKGTKSKKKERERQRNRQNTKEMGKRETISKEERIAQEEPIWRLQVYQEMERGRDNKCMVGVETWRRAVF